MVRVVDEVETVVRQQLPLKTDDAEYRVPPLALTRFARGGKTTTLSEIYDRLKRNGLNPILITFSGQGSRAYLQRQGESQTEFLRIVYMYYLHCCRVHP